jgi:hypothetical protein
LAESTSTPAAAPAAHPGPSPSPKAADIGQKRGSVIDQTSQSTLAEKIVRGAATQPAANDAPKEEPKVEAKAPPAAANDDKEKPAPPGPQKYKVKIDGKEQEVTLDELQRGYQLRATSDKRLQEASELEKKLQSVLQVIQSDTGAALKAAGLTDEQVESFAVQLIAGRQRAWMEQEKLKNATPEEQELHRLRKLEADWKKQQEDAARQQREWHVQQVKGAITNLVISTLEHLPKEYRKNDFVASRALDAWQYAYENQKDLQARGVALTPESVAKSLRAEVEGLSKAAQAQLALPPKETVEPAEVAAQPGKPVSRKQEKAKEEPERQGLTQAQLIRQITLGER